MLDRDHIHRAQRVGASWADAKAERLTGDIPAMSWPDAWHPDWNEGLPEDLTAIGQEQVEILTAEAQRAAASRWRRLVRDQREREDLEDEERDQEVRARELERMIRDDLPSGLTVGRDGPRVFLLDQRTFEELTVNDLEDADRRIEWWRERSH